MNEKKDKKVSELFDEGFELFQKINKSDEPTNSGKLQLLIRKSIDLLENSTNLVSLIGLFSRNEDIEEIATADLKFLLLPALLGQLTLKLFSEDRVNIIETAEIYFKDFLQRCKDYSLTDHNIRNNDEEDPENSEAVALPHINSRPDLLKMAQERNTKIQRYRDQKALDQELDKLQELMSQCNFDEDTHRKYYLSLIKSYIYQSIDELKSIELEKPILAHMAKVRSPGTLASKEIDEKINKKSVPLQAVIITKDEIQKKVFGAGYPSLPRMSVAEFYESRIQDGTFSNSAVRISTLNQDRARIKEETMSQEEIDSIRQEELIEQDDNETLARARAMDEYKDEYKRGWGNRYNRS